MSGQPPNASHVLCDITFDSIATPDDDMVGHLISMATVLKAPERLNRTKEQIAEYFECCRAGMPPNPFHNWTHVFDVTQLCFTLLTSSGLDQHMSDAQTMGLFFAAIAHDLGHRGRSNAYEINEKTDLAVKYPGNAPLEAHHEAMCNAAMDASGLLEGLPPAKGAQIRSLVHYCISATDMGLHGKIMKACGEAFAEGLTPSDFFSVEGADEHGEASNAHLLMQILIKGSDINNPSRPGPVANKWNEMCYEEFYAEGDVDREKGRTLNPLHDRDNNVICKSTIGFIGFVVTPIFKMILKFIENAHKSGCEGLSTTGVEGFIAALDANKAAHAEAAEALAAAAAAKAEPEPEALTSADIIDNLD